MHHKTYSKIFNIAQDARAFIEHFAKDNPTIGDAKTLQCYCAIAAAHLFTALKANGVRAQVAVNDLHAFVLVDDYIVDITATQFGPDYPDVVFMPLEAKLSRERFWQPRKTFTNMKEVRQHQVKRQWSEDQHVVFDIC